MINELFAANQKDLSLDDVGVQWLGHRVLLYSKTNGETVGMLTTANVVEKVQRFCVKTNRRCSQIQNGKVML